MTVWPSWNRWHHCIVATDKLWTLFMIMLPLSIFVQVQEFVGVHENCRKSERVLPQRRDTFNDDTTWICWNCWRKLIFILSYRSTLVMYVLHYLRCKLKCFKSLVRSFIDIFWTNLHSYRLMAHCQIHQLWFSVLLLFRAQFVTLSICADKITFHSSHVVFMVINTVKTFQGQLTECVHAFWWHQNMSW